MLHALFSGIVTGLVFVAYIAVVGMIGPARRTKPMRRWDPPRRKRGKQGVIWIHLESDRGVVQPAAHLRTVIRTSPSRRNTLTPTSPS